MKRASRTPALPLVLLAIFLFMALPALLAFAGADVPESSRSIEAYQRESAMVDALLKEHDAAPDTRIFILVTKEPAELSAWAEQDDGRYAQLKSWPICMIGEGGLGPKMMEGDEISPEGFYAVTADVMNPLSTRHLSFNIGYPNNHDQLNGYTGSYIMVHGECSSKGCFAMTDGVMDQIWALMKRAFDDGQTSVPVHIYPFAMTKENMAAHKGDPAFGFWKTLQPGWVFFDATKRVPNMIVRKKAYVLGKSLDKAPVQTAGDAALQDKVLANRR